VAKIKMTESVFKAADRWNV